MDREQAFIGGLLIDPHMIKVIKFNRNDLRTTVARRVYDRIYVLVEAGDDVDPVTLGLDDDTMKYVMDAMIDVPTALHVETYAKQIAEEAYRRRQLTHAGRIATIANDKDNNVRAEIEQVRVEMGEDTYSEQTGIHIKTVASDAFDRYEKGESGTVLSSGMTPVDQVVGYFRPGVTLLGGRPGAGKSMLLQGIMKGFLEDNEPGWFGCLEMTQEQHMDRMMSVESTVRQSRLTAGTLNEDEWKKIPTSMAVIGGWPMYISDGAWTTDQLRAELIKQKAENSITWFSIDYLERLRDKTPGLKGWERTEVVARKLINIAKDLELVGVVVQKIIKSGWEGVADMDDFAGGSDLAYDAISMVVLTEHTPQSGEAVENMRTLVNVKPNRLTEQYSRLCHLVKSDHLPIILPEAKFGGS